jgi:hypothetical protein
MRTSAARIILLLFCTTGCQERFENPIILPAKDSKSLTLSSSDNGTVWYDTSTDKVALWDGKSTSFLASTSEVDKAKKDAIEQAVAQAISAFPSVPASSGVIGANGANGLNVYSGSTIPSDSTGRDDETYFDVSTGDIYKKTSGIWAVEGNLFISSGLLNLSVHQGPVSPPDSYGNNGETFINSSNGNILLKGNGVWAVTGNIMGAPGQPGSQGLQGPQGVSGATITDTQATGKLLTGFASGAGPVSASDSILSAIDKLDGNISSLSASKQNLLGFTPISTSGGSMTGFLTLNANPSSNMGAATKQYVDSAVSGIQPQDLSAYLTISSAGSTYATSSVLASDVSSLNSAINAKQDILSMSPPLLNSMGTLSITQASSSSGGYLSSTDWSIFNGKQSSLGYAPMSRSGDTMTGVLVLSANPTATNGAATKGYVDTLFASQSGSYISALTGDGTLSGYSSGLATLTLSSSGVATGVYGSGSLIPVITVSAKGLVTSASTTPFSVSVTESSVSGLVSDLASKAPLASPSFTGSVVVGTSSSSLVVNGQMYSAEISVASTTSTNSVNFATGNVQVMTGSTSAPTLSGIVSGGSYTLITQDSVSTTRSFFGGCDCTHWIQGPGATTAGSKTMYNFLVTTENGTSSYGVNASGGSCTVSSGVNCYVSWVTGI